MLESKASMKTRGLKSPDRAEASLLAIYRPVLLVSRRRRGILNSRRRYEGPPGDRADPRA